jgi:hypothetical protein
VISFGNIVEGILSCYFLKVVEKRFEQIFLRAYGVVPRKMVSDDISDICFLERNNKTLKIEILLNQALLF